MVKLILCLSLFSLKSLFYFAKALIIFGTAKVDNCHML